MRSGIEWLRGFSFLRLHANLISLKADTNTMEDDSANTHACEALEEDRPSDFHFLPPTHTIRAS